MNGADRWRVQMREAEMETAITELVTIKHGLVWSIRDSRGMNVAHMPDLIVVAPWLATGTVMLVELKSQKRVLTPGQREALSILSQCSRFDSMIVRPGPRDETETDYDTFLAMLRGD